MNRRFLLVAALLTVVGIGFCVFFSVRDISRYRSDTQAFVNSPYQSSWLLYLQACSPDAESPDTLADQLSRCDRRSDRKAGYYLYDFALKRSLHIDDSLMRKIVAHDMLVFPDSLSSGTVRNGGNTFNDFVPVERFSGFPLSCVESDSAISCMTDVPGVGPETHVLEKADGLDLFALQGVATGGSDWYKLLKPLMTRTPLALRLLF